MAKYKLLFSWGLLHRFKADRLLQPLVGPLLIPFNLIRTVILFTSPSFNFSSSFFHTNQWWAIKVELWENLEINLIRWRVNSPDHQSIFKLLLSHCSSEYSATHFIGMCSMTLAGAYKEGRSGSLESLVSLLSFTMHLLASGSHNALFHSLQSRAHICLALWPCLTHLKRNGRTLPGLLNFELHVWLCRATHHHSAIRAA